MKKTKMLVLLALAVVVTLTLTGCGPEIRDIDPGYIGMILSPTGYQSKILEAGQVDIGDTDYAGRGNKLVTCEATSVTIEEHFAGKQTTEDKEDHRIITKSKVPLAVDIYVQVMLPEDPDLRRSVFAQATPVPDEKIARLSTITLSDIYTRFAQMTIRGKTREIFARYHDYDDIMAHYPQINKEVAAIIADTFTRTKVPLMLVAGQLSNVKPDESVWAAENRKAAATQNASAINTEGEAIRKNPGYLQKYQWDTLKDIAGKNNLTIIVNGAGAPIGYNVQPNK